MIIAEIILLIGVLAWVAATLASRSADEPRNAIAMKVQLRNSHETVYLHQQPDGSHRFEIRRLTGQPQMLTAEQFASRVYEDQKTRGWLSKLLNISSRWGIIWVGLGLLGQVLFTGRMVVQWLASEKSNRSVVPPAFWWMSLIGATMLMVYFIWRKDVVGVLGQSVGWFIYIRNLLLIYNGSSVSPAATPDDTPDQGQPESAIGMLPVQTAPVTTHHPRQKHDE